MFNKKRDPFEDISEEYYIKHYTFFVSVNAAWYNLLTIRDKHARKEYPYGLSLEAWRK